MSDLKIKKGFDIRLEGEASKQWESAPFPDAVALKPSDFMGIIPLLNVKVGDRVKSFTPLFVDKSRPHIKFTSPVSGTVADIIRGERRVVREIIIRPDNKKNSEKIKIPLLKKTSEIKRETILSVLLETGLFAGFISRPFGYIPDPGKAPRDIFISAHDTSPLAPDWNFIVSEYSEEFAAGIKIISRLTDGRVRLAVNAHEKNLCAPLAGSSDADIIRVTGPHPAGNTGTIIHLTAPIRGIHDIVWTCSPLQVIRIGRLFLEGDYPAESPVAVTGSSSLKEERVYYKTIQGASISRFVGSMFAASAVRFISGSVLTGTKIGQDGFVGYNDASVTVIPEPSKSEFMGWASPGLNKLSASGSFLSSLFRRGARFTADAGLKGGKRAFVATGIYEDVLPMDIYPVFLMKAVLAGDIEEMISLGILELIEEDVALCEFIDPSKNSWQKILRDGLDNIHKEG